MKASKRLAVALALICLAGSLAGCAKKEVTPSDEPALVIATPAPKANVTQLSVAIPAQVESYHPLLASQRQVRSLLGLVYESLVAYDADGNPVGELASTLEPDSSARVWRVSLRTQATWQGTGRAISTDDVLFTLDLLRQIGEASPYAYVFDYLESWSKVDDTLIDFTFKHGFMGNLLALDFPILPCDAGYSLTGTPLPPVGTGPYIMSPPAEDGSVTLNVNPAWWKQAPAIRTVLAKPYRDSASAASSLMLRQVDMVQTADIVTDQYSYAGDANSYGYATPYFEFLAFNFDRPLVQDVRLRQAIAAAIDRRALVASVYMGHAILADAPFYPGSALSGSQTGSEVDLPKARMLLSQTGWAMDQSLTLLVYDDKELSLRVEAAGLIAKQLSELGIRVKTVAKSGSDFTAALEAGEYDMVLAGWYLSDIPDLTFALSSEGSGNIMHYRSEAMDQRLLALLDSGREGFDQALARVKALLKGEVPLVSLYFRSHTFLTAAQVRGVSRVEEDDALAFIDQWLITPTE